MSRLSKGLRLAAVVVLLAGGRAGATTILYRSADTLTPHTDALLEELATIPVAASLEAGNGEQVAGWAAEGVADERVAPLAVDYALGLKAVPLLNVGEGDGFCAEPGTRRISI